MSRNYGLGTRDMAQAGRIALAQACSRGELSFASVDALADRWAQFAAHAKAEGVGRMERVTPELLQQYGRELASQVRAGQLSASYAQNLVSAANSVLHQVRDWRSVSPTRDCLIPQRSGVRDTPPMTEKTTLSTTLATLREQGQQRGAAVAELARQLGLRSKEASLINPTRALQEAQSRGVVTISEGTKGGRTREVPAAAPGQLQALHRAAAAQGQARSLVPPAQTWAQWRDGGLRDTREALQAGGYAGLHELRAAYACERYQALAGHAAPVMGGQIQDKVLDRATREQISTELGHDRIEVVAAYVGGR